MNRAVRQRRKEQRQAMMASARAERNGHLFTPNLVDQILDVLSLANEVIESYVRPEETREEQMNTNWLRGALWLLKLLAGQTSQTPSEPVANTIHAKKMGKRPPGGVNIWRDDFEFVEPGKPTKAKQAKAYNFSASVYK